MRLSAPLPHEQVLTMSLLSGVNHVAILTFDLERFIAFYSRVFEAKVVFHETSPFAHAILRVGASSWLHPVEAPNSPHAVAMPRMFERGHLDHLALTASSAAAFGELRERLMACSASNGAVDDLGAFHTLAFEDPDGMRGELTLIVDPELVEIHEPRPLMPSAISAPSRAIANANT
jgi:catechol 2,3-dioxygenase-like lactoylglutathione lyase family enzyme